MWARIAERAITADRIYAHAEPVGSLVREASAGRPGRGGGYPPKLYA
jgi:hypothetical protein